MVIMPTVCTALDSSFYKADRELITRTFDTTGLLKYFAECANAKVIMVDIIVWNAGGVTLVKVVQKNFHR